MPQGKLKVKTKLPAKTKSKKKVKGPAVTKRGSRPIAPKKQKNQEAQKLKKIITKNVNEAMEDDLRARALDGKKSLVSKKSTSGRAKGSKKKT
ncbi:hypothetical protein L798_02856 [Zootermopsis nevadensis]|uniref:Uncharacterized protein n=1 Tax=Zootermopsis nevadensis TaxID=136037 RepID=A0A067RDX1_ZOONE|nr:hypothetical protein L798_02856 [Zootermopsis nevadensis]